MKSLFAIIPLILICISCETPPTDDANSDCKKYCTTIAISFEKETWEPGEYYFHAFLSEVDTTYTCAFVVPNMFARPFFSENCIAGEINLWANSEEEGYSPGGLHIKRSDFSSLYFSAVYHHEDLETDAENLIQDYEILPEWKEDECGCDISEDVTIDFDDENMGS